jgi:hypothetical protein
MAGSFSSRTTSGVAKDQLWASRLENGLRFVIHLEVKQMSSPVLKVHSLTGRITLPLLFQAFKAVKRNRGKAGIDKVSIQMLEANLEQNLLALMKDLKEGSFQPFPLRRAYIPKNEKEMRPLGIPAVRDRVAQEVVRRLLTPYFEPHFHPHSFAYIRGRNAHQAIRSLLARHRQGLRMVLDADIKGFLDPASHYTPFHESPSKRSGCVPITLMHEPFEFLVAPKDRRWLAQLYTVRHRFAREAGNS